MSEDEHTESELIASYFIGDQTFHITAARWNSRQLTDGPFDLFWVMREVKFSPNIEPISEELDHFPTYQDVVELAEEIE